LGEEINMASISELENLATMARSALLANIVATSEGQMLTAGHNQFKTLWTRDFCFSVPGLLAIGESHLVRRQIEMYFKFQRADGLIPRGVDVCPPQLRVVANSVHRRIASLLPQYENRKLKPEYYGEHRTEAFDSGVLLVLALLQYLEHEKLPLDLDQYGSHIKKTLDFYLSHKRNGLVQQAAYSDWQDSARRKGAGLYLHVLLLVLAQKIRSYDFGKPLFDGLEKAVFSNFFDQEKKVFRQDGFKQIPLEANLWIIEHKLMEEYVNSDELYQNLKRTKIWSNLGTPIWPSYPPNEVSLTTKVVGLRSYHDGLHWPWLMAEAARIAMLQNDPSEADHIFSKIADFVEQSNGIGEVYLSNGSPFRSTFYRSEMPFSWSAAKILQALVQLKPFGQRLHLRPWPNCENGPA
jgi:glycogen debranching enzyme